MMKSICWPLMPPAALISLTASLAPLAAGTSSDASSPVKAKPPPILIVPPAAAEPDAAVDADAALDADAPVEAAGELAPEAAVDAAGELEQAASKVAAASVTNPFQGVVGFIIALLDDPGTAGIPPARTGL